MAKMTIKINVEGLKKGLKKDSLASIEVDNEGTPMDIFWFKRLRDSKYDNCISIVEEIKTDKKRK